MIWNTTHACDCKPKLNYDKETGSVDIHFEEGTQIVMVSFLDKATMKQFLDACQNYLLSIPESVDKPTTL